MGWLLLVGVVVVEMKENKKQINRANERVYGRILEETKTKSRWLGLENLYVNCTYFDVFKNKNKKKTNFS